VTASSIAKPQSALDEVATKAVKDANEQLMLEVKKKLDKQKSRKPRAKSKKPVASDHLGARRVVKEPVRFDPSGPTALTPHQAPKGPGRKKRAPAENPDASSEDSEEEPAPKKAKMTTGELRLKAENKRLKAKLAQISQQAPSAPAAPPATPAAGGDLAPQLLHLCSSLIAALPTMIGAPRSQQPLPQQQAHHHDCCTHASHPCDSHEDRPCCCFDHHQHQRHGRH